IRSPYPGGRKQRVVSMARSTARLDARRSMTGLFGVWSRAMAGDQRILAVTQRRATDDNPAPQGLYRVGVTAGVIDGGARGYGAVVRGPIPNGRGCARRRVTRPGGGGLRLVARRVGRVPRVSQRRQPVGRAIRLPSVHS